MSRNEIVEIETEAAAAAVVVAFESVENVE